MTTSRNAFLAEILGDDVISEGKRAYFRRRLSNHLFAVVVNEFRRLEKSGLTRAQLARRIGKQPEQITRWFSSSGNWTIETLSDLLLGMKCEPSVQISPLANETGHASRAVADPHLLEASQSQVQISYGTGGAIEQMDLEDADTVPGFLQKVALTTGTLHAQ